MTFDFDNLDPYDPKFCVFKQCFPIIFQNFGALRHISAYNEIFKLNLENKDHIHTSHSPFNQSFWVQIHQFQLGFRVESRSFWVHFFFAITPIVLITTNNEHLTSIKGVNHCCFSELLLALLAA